MKTRVLTIGSAAVLLALAVGAGGLYAYDSSRSDVIAKGITAGGVDVGGLNAALARDVLQRSREGNFLGRAVRDLRGGEVRDAVPLRVANSRQKLHGFIDVIAKEIDRP